MTSPENKRLKVIGLLGAGVMGAGAGAKVMEAGYELVVSDPMPKARQWAQNTGARLVKSPARLSEEADLVLMFLPGPKQIAECVTGPDGLLSAEHPCQVIVDLATSLPANSRDMKKGRGRKRRGIHRRARPGASWFHWQMGSSHRGLRRRH